jgi:Flp pilus assembly protein TadB
MTDDPATGAPATPPARPAAPSRRLLWVLLVVALAANGTASVLSQPVVAAVFGVVVLVLGALLVRDHLRRRGQR